MRKKKNGRIAYKLIQWLLLLICIVGVLGIACSMIPAEEERYTVRINDPRSACVIITDGYGQGSGVHIGNGIILTAGHCTNIPGAWVVDNTGRTYTIIDQWADPFGEDVGFIKIRNVDLPKLSFGCTAKVTDTVLVIGNPLELYYSFNVTKGIVSRVMTDIPGWWYDAMIIDAAIYPGNSGSPILNSNNEIVGILVGAYGGYDSFGICEPIADIIWSFESFSDYEKNK